MIDQPLSPIGGGLNESVSRTEQPQGSYVEGENVRGIDPRTGKVVWGAQRAGLTACGDFVGAFPRHFTTGSRLVEERVFAALNETAQPNTVPAQVASAWQENLGERVLDVATGLDGQAHFLMASGDVVIVNREGEETERVPSAVPRGFTAVPRVFVGERGEVYTAATRSEQFEGGAGRIYRWVRDADGIWSAEWESVIPGPVTNFVYRRGAMYAATGSYKDEDDITQSPSLVRISQPLLGPEIAWTEDRVAWPVYGLDITDRGQLVVSSPANPDRNSGLGQGFAGRAVSWTPPELAAASTNLLVWLDALAINEEGETPQDGDVVTLVRDRRQEPTEFDPIISTDAVRELRAPDSDILRGPTFDQSAFGGQGGLRFDGLTALVSGPSTSTTDRSLMAALLPGDVDEWQATLLLQFDEAQASQAVRRILSQFTTAAGQPSWVMVANDLAVSLLNGTGGTTSPGATPGTTSLTAILTFQVVAGSCQVYLNGALVASGVFGSTTQGGPYEPFPLSLPGFEREGPRTVLGSGNPNDQNILSADGVSLILEPEGGIPGTQIEAQSYRDGNLEGEDSNTIDRFIVTMPNPVAFDTVVLHGVNPQRMPLQFRVRGYATALSDPVSYEEVFTLEPQEETGWRRTIQVPRLTVNGLLVFELEALTTNGRGFRLSELQFLDQQLGTATESASFWFGGMNVIRNASNTERQFIEGYWAHWAGIADTLDPSHLFFGVGNVPQGTGSTLDPSTAVAGVLNSGDPIVAKYGTDGEPLAAYSGAGVGLGAVVDGDKIFTIGDTEPANDQGALVTRFLDEPAALVREGALSSGVRPNLVPTPMAVGPCSSVFFPFQPQGQPSELRRIDGRTLMQAWSIPQPFQALGVVPAGLPVDREALGGDCGPEFLYVASRAASGAQRIDVMGLQETGEEAGLDIEKLAVLSNGDVMRSNDGPWELVEAGALPGPLPHSATLFGLTIFADGVGYRAYEDNTGRLRDFEAATAGDLPARCQLIAKYGSRLALARGDNPFTLHFSAIGDPTNFRQGFEIQSLEQAVSGTTGSQGRVPEPITALMPFRDDYLFIGTTESLYVLTGDLGDGGRLDQVDTSHGVAFGYAWCESPSGIYYFSARGGLMRVSPGGGIEAVSANSIQRRLEEIDLDANRVRLAYNWIDKAVHIYVIPKALGSQVQHFVFEEPLRAWHIDSFGEGLDNNVTAVASLNGDRPEDRAVILGFARGGVRLWDQYAEDDAGRDIRSHVIVGPMVPGSSGLEVRVSGISAEIDSDMGPVEVAIHASDSADRPGPPSDFKRLEPGRGLGAAFNASAPSVFAHFRGLGRPWTIHGARAEIQVRGRARRLA